MQRVRAEDECRRQLALVGRDDMDRHLEDDGVTVYRVGATRGLAPGAGWRRRRVELVQAGGMVDGANGPTPSAHSPPWGTTSTPRQQALVVREPGGTREREVPPSASFSSTIQFCILLPSTERAAEARNRNSITLQHSVPQGVKKDVNEDR